MDIGMFVIPWPQYSDDGFGITWLLRVEAPKFRGTLQWSTALGRFRKDNHIWRLRRGSPQIYRQAVEHMRDFCSKLQQKRDMSTVTENRENVT